MQKIVSFFMSIVAFFYGLFGLPYYAVGRELNLDDYTLTFEDNFDILDRNIWSGNYTYGKNSEIRNGGFWNHNLAYAEDGNLIIPLRYFENGYGGKGAGWYSAGLDTDDDAKNGFSQLYGYFEVRCKLPKAADVWGAFWLMNEGVFNVDKSGKDGTEIDVFESPYYGERKNNMISSNLHYDGYESAHKKLGAKKFLVKGNPYEEFNTYGVEWNENEYIFYINGVETFRTSFGGVSKNPEYLLLSLEISGNNGIPSGRKGANGDECEYVVDYVKVYRKNSRL